jgi:DNA-binding transcriptional LysR family regulator
LLSSSQRLVEEGKGIAQGELGWLGIGFTRSTLFSVVPAAVRTMKAAYPKVRIDLGEVLTEHQSEKLRQGAIHVGISRMIGAVVPEPDLAYLPLFDDQMVAALPADHPLAAKDSVCVGDFGALPFISYPKDPSSHFSRHVLYQLEVAGGRPIVGYEAQEIHTALGLVAAGLGVTVVGCSVAAQNRTDVRFLPIDDLSITSRVYAVHLGEHNPMVDAFLQILQRQVQLDT